MRFSATVLAAAALAGVASAATIEVQVGQGGDRFTPTSVTAAQGDTVKFTFFEDREHNLITAQGPTAEGACQPADGGIALPFQATGATYDVAVNNTEPVYMFCSPHCQSKGMVFIINPGATSVAQYAAAARGEAIPAGSSSAAASATSAASALSSSASQLASSVSSDIASRTSSLASVVSSITARPTAPNAAAAMAPAGLLFAAIPALAAAFVL